MSNYKYCVVPLCTSTTKSAPEKRFFSVPRSEDIRKSWMEKMRRKDPVSSKSNVYCCEDHFDIPSDLITGGAKLKPSVIPHRFQCQQSKHEEQKAPKRKSPRKRGQLQSSPANQVIDPTYVMENINEVDEPGLPLAENEQPSFVDLDFVVVDPEVFNEQINQGGTNDHAACTTEPAGNQSALVDLAIADVGPNDKCVQADIPLPKPSTRSRGSQPPKRGWVTTSVGCSPFKSPSKYPQKSPSKANWNITETLNAKGSFDSRKNLNSHFKKLCFDSSSESDHITPTESDEYSSSSDESFVLTSDDESSSSSASSESVDESGPIDEEDIKWQQISLQRTRYLYTKSPRLYLGLTKESLSIIDLLAYKLNYRPIKILAADIVTLIFRKIRLNESFEFLGNEYGISTNHASRLFGKYITFIADHMKELIVWPDSLQLRTRLPVPFRKNFGKVESIIDCFETEVETPSNALFQAMTWSDYKKANTLKVFISFTADGVVNFVSKAYGGRTTDEMITSVCGFLEAIPHPGIHIMADRGFKRIETLLNAKQCTLVRPPSVSSGQKFCKNDVILTRRIAGIRIHVERGISRLREFKFILPHAMIDNKLVKYFDDAVVIACGLINLQGPLIR